MTEDEVNRNLGSRIREVRIKRGLSQAQVAKGYRGKSSGAQSHYESGNRAVSIYRLSQISQVLNVPLEWWLTGDDYWNSLMEESQSDT